MTASLPPIPAGWAATRSALHRAAQVIGAVRAGVAEPEPNWTHLGLRAIPTGLTSGELPGVGELALHFADLSIHYVPPEGDPVRIALDGHTQPALLAAVEQALKAAGHPVTPKRDKIGGEEPLAGDSSVAATYAVALHSLFRVLEQVRASLPGQTSRVVVWPHGFDAAFLWFATDEATEDAPHMAFGFSPYSAGLERPYLYSYAYPRPDGLTDTALPAPARWHTNGWTGALIPYDSLVGGAAPGTTLPGLLREIHARIAPLLDGQAGS